MKRQSTLRRQSICGRAVTAGPGSCWFWWESCPDKVRHCFNRFIRENGGSVDLDQAEAWSRARDADVRPEKRS